MKNTKQTKKGLRLIVLFTLAVFGAFLYNVYTIFSQVLEKNNEAAFLKGEITRLREEEQYLKNEVEKLNDPDYVARYARERYLYSRDGEFTIRIPEAQ